MIKFFKVWDDYISRVRSKWGEFSNFYRRNFYFDGYTFPSSEHAYQALKYKYVGGGFFNEDRFHTIRTAPTCKAACDLGRDPAFPFRPDWEEYKTTAMYLVLRAKFGEHEDLREVLLSTGDEEIVEDSPTDGYWGRGPDWKGRNQLGKCLMLIRSAYQQYEKQEVKEDGENPSPFEDIMRLVDK